MQLQLATLQPRLNAALDGVRLLLTYAVRDNIICISLKRHHWVRLAHPLVESEVQKDVGQQRANYSPNAKCNFQFDRVVAGWRNTPIIDLRLKW